MKSIEEKAELWDYYQDLVKSSGFDGVTDLLAENRRLQAIIDGVSQSLRITEQDALEIAEKHYKYRRNKAANNIGSGFSDWFADEGHELLAKLNKRV